MLNDIGQFTNPAEVMEVRILIEPRIANLAAMYATLADIDHMKRCLEKLEYAVAYKGNGKDGVIYDRWDGTLHRAIAESTGNTLLLILFDSLNSVRSHYMWGRLQTAAMTNTRWQLYCRQHRRVVEAIALRDAILAERSMHEHLEAVRNNLLEVKFLTNDGNHRAPMPLIST